jgi:quercetin dioxygenase-like cupin family protein
MKPVRRLVTADDERGKSRAIVDGPAPEVRTDPARPGYSSTRIWLTDRTPARLEPQFFHAPQTHALIPPPGGSVCHIVEIPPDDALPGKLAATARRATMQKRRTLEFCLVLEGEVTLVLDLEEVQLHAGDVVVQRGTRHAWSNRSARPCRIAISSHDATEDPS